MTIFTTQDSFIMVTFIIIASNDENFTQCYFFFDCNSSMNCSFLFSIWKQRQSQKHKYVQCFVVWSFISSSFECLPTESILNGEISTADNKKSYHVDDEHTADTEYSSFSTELITESRSSAEPHKRVKRVLVFRPLFVYRQEQIKRRRIIEKRKERSQKKIVADDNKLPTQRPKLEPCNCCQRCQCRCWNEIHANWKTELNFQKKTKTRKIWIPRSFCSVEKGSFLKNVPQATLFAIV